MEEETVHIEFEPNYELKFLSESTSSLRNGDSTYVYTTNTLKLLTDHLNGLKIEYVIKQFDEYWEILPTKFKERKKYERKNKENKK